MELAVPLLPAGIVPNHIVGAAVFDALDNRAIEVIRVQESASARLLGNLDQTILFAEPLEYFLAVCFHMLFDGQLHPAVRIAA